MRETLRVEAELPQRWLVTKDLLDRVVLETRVADLIAERPSSVRLKRRPITGHQRQPQYGGYRWIAGYADRRV